MPPVRPLMFLVDVGTGIPHTNQVPPLLPVVDWHKSLVGLQVLEASAVSLRVRLVTQMGTSIGMGCFVFLEPLAAVSGHACFSALWAISLGTVESYVR